MVAKLFFFLPAFSDISTGVQNCSFLKRARPKACQAFSKHNLVAADKKAAPATAFTVHHAQKEKKFPSTMGAQNGKEENVPQEDGIGFMCCDGAARLPKSRRTGLVSGNGPLPDAVHGAPARLLEKGRNSAPLGGQMSPNVRMTPTHSSGEPLIARTNLSVEVDTTQKTVRSILRSGDARSVSSAKSVTSNHSVGSEDSRRSGRSGRSTRSQASTYSTENRKSELASLASKIMELQKKDDNLMTQVEVKLFVICENVIVA